MAWSQPEPGPLVKGAAPGVGVSVGVGVGVGVGVVDPGDGDGEPNGVDAGEDGVGTRGATTPLTLGAPLGLVDAALDWVVGTEPWTVGVPEPLVVPGARALLEGEVPGPPEFA